MSNKAVVVECFMGCLLPPVDMEHLGHLLGGPFGRSVFCIKYMF